jgi:hypothetical protein
MCHRSSLPFRPLEDNFNGFKVFSDMSILPQGSVTRPDGENAEQPLSLGGVKSKVLELFSRVFECQCGPSTHAFTRVSSDDRKRGTAN